MSDLNRIERLHFEKIFDMNNGYVLDFSNRTFDDFVLENVQIEIYAEKYNLSSGSKANRLRAFWDKESNFLVYKINTALLDYWKAFKNLRNEEITELEQKTYNECLRVIDRLKLDLPVENIEAIKPNFDDKDFTLLAKNIKDCILRNEPEIAIDRLHTFVVKYIRELCSKYDINFDKSKPLHSIFGEYIKQLKDKNIIESQMTERILKTSISIMEAFNDVRNNKSFAHDNQILNHKESLLILNNVANTIRFIDDIEQSKTKVVQEQSILDDFPF